MIKKSKEGQGHGYLWEAGYDQGGARRRIWEWRLHLVSSWGGGYLDAHLYNYALHYIYIYIYMFMLFPPSVLYSTVKRGRKR